EIEKQLQTHGMENIRKQIQDVQKDISQTKSELNTIINELPRNETHLGTLEQTITEQQQKMRFSKEMINAWYTSYEQEVNYNFISCHGDKGYRYGKCIG